MKNIWMLACLAVVVFMPVTAQAASEPAANSAAATGSKGAPASANKEEKLFEEPWLTPQKLGTFLRECRAENEGDAHEIRKCYNDKVDALSAQHKQQEGL
jgi:hypothetical protein